MIIKQLYKNLNLESGDVATLFLHGFLPVFLGGLIYIIWRSTSLLMFSWFDGFGLTSHINVLRNISFAVPEWVIYSLPSGLWIYSFSFILIYIWHDAKSKSKYLWMSLAPIIALSSELGQLIGVIPGTFDLADIALYMVFIGLSILAVWMLRQKNSMRRVNNER